MRPIPYEVTMSVDSQTTAEQGGRALSLNISSGGMLVMMDRAPAVEQVVKVYVPTPVIVAETPTLAEVRWTRRVPFGGAISSGPYFVGLKFMF